MCFTIAYELDTNNINRIVVWFIDIYHDMGRFSRRQTDDIFSLSESKAPGEFIG